MIPDGDILTLLQPRTTGIQMKTTAMHDNGGRRTGVDRRQFTYAVHIPERRSGKDRRTNQDRRMPRQEAGSVPSRALS